MKTLLQKFDVDRARRELRERGCFLIENAYSAEFCQTAIAFIDGKEKDPSTEVNYAGTEIRVWDSQKKNPQLAEFFESSKSALEALMNKKLKPHTLLAIRNYPTAEDVRLRLGRWHVDSFFKQMKVFVFLTDTTEESGPFEYVPASHRRSFKLRMLARGVYFRLSDLFRPQRTYQKIDDSHIGRLADRGYRPLPVICRAGTVMIVDTSALHRARPCLKGNRYALTSYFF